MDLDKRLKAQLDDLAAKQKAVEEEAAQIQQNQSSNVTSMRTKPAESLGKDSARLMELTEMINNLQE